MAIRYTNIFHRKTLQNLPKIAIFALKTNHLAAQCAIAGAKMVEQQWLRKLVLVSML
jgi:hypothetical protein